MSAMVMVSYESVFCAYLVLLCQLFAAVIYAVTLSKEAKQLQKCGTDELCTWG